MAGCGEVEQDSDFELLFATSRLCVKHVSFSRVDAKTQRNEEEACGEVGQDSDVALLFATSRLCVKHVSFSRKDAKPRRNEEAEFPIVILNHTMESSGFHQI